jgi:putative SOS response-associated peptidase YedK
LIGSSTEHSSPLLIGFYNIAPTREVPVIIRNDGRNEAKLMKWELVPSWASDPSMGQRIINARSETLSKAVVQASVEKRTLPDSRQGLL